MKQVICGSQLSVFLIHVKVITSMQGNLAIVDNVQVSSPNQVESAKLKEIR